MRDFPETSLSRPVCQYYYPVKLVYMRDFLNFLQNLACLKVRTKSDTCEDLEKTGEG